MANKSFIELLQAGSTNRLDTIAMVNSGTTDTFQINKQFFLSNQVPFKYVNGNGNIATMFCSDNSITEGQMYSSILGGLQHRIISSSSNIGVGNTIAGGWQNGISAPGFGNFIAGGRQNFIEGDNGSNYNFIGGGFRNTINTQSRSTGAAVGASGCNVDNDGGFGLVTGENNNLRGRWAILGGSSNTFEITWGMTQGLGNTSAAGNSFMAFTFGDYNQIRGAAFHTDYHFGSSSCILRTQYIYNVRSNNGTLGSYNSTYANASGSTGNFYGRNNSIIGSVSSTMLNPTTNTTRGDFNGILFSSGSTISGSSQTGLLFSSGSTAIDKTNAIGIGLKDRTLIANDTTHLEALILMTPLTEYPNNAAAKAGGLLDGQLYRDSSGGVHIVFT